MRRDRSDSFSMTQLVVLGLLCEREMHAAEIAKAVAAHLSGGQLHRGIVYPLLHDCSRQGWVSEHTARTNRGRTVRYYNITHPGRERLRLIAGEWGGVKKSIDRLLTKPSRLPQVKINVPGFVGLQV